MAARGSSQAVSGVAPLPSLPVITSTNLMPFTIPLTIDPTVHGRYIRLSRVQLAAGICIVRAGAGSLSDAVTEIHRMVDLLSIDIFLRGLKNALDSPSVLSDHVLMIS